MLECTRGVFEREVCREDGILLLLEIILLLLLFVIKADDSVNCDIRSVSSLFVFKNNVLVSASWIEIE